MTFFFRSTFILVLHSLYKSPTIGILLSMLIFCKAGITNISLKKKKKKKKERKKKKKNSVENIYKKQMIKKNN